MSILPFPPAAQGVALVLGGALLRAFYIVNNKRALRRYSSRFVILINMFGCAMILAPFLVASGALQHIDWLSWPAGILWPLLVTSILNILIQYGEIRSLALEDASLVTPISATAPVLSVLSGFLLLQELPTAAGWVGILCISIGSYALAGSMPEAANGVVSLSGVRRHLHRAASMLMPWRRLAQSAGVRIALLSSLAASISIAFDKLVTLKSGPLLLPVVAFTVVGVSQLPRLRKEDVPKRLSARDAAGLLLSPVIFAAVSVLFILGFYFGTVSGVSALRRVSILFVALLAGSLLGERGHPERIAAAALMASGAILLAF